MTNIIKCLRFESVDKVIHFIGIGGIGMSGMAEILHNLGYEVQGSDAGDNDNVKRLRNLGIRVFVGHEASNVDNVSVVVKSTAIKDDNIEVVTARQKRIPTIKRAEMLAELMRLKISIAISGSHGKTTTTSMVANLFEQASLKPTVINGGIINTYGTNAHLGDGDYIIAEADESDATFVKVPATIGVMTNVDPEHLDYYGNFDELKKACLKFFKNIPFYGFGVACVDNKVLEELISKIIDKEVITYGIDNLSADVRAVNIRAESDKSIYDVQVSKRLNLENNYIKDIVLPMAGQHNVLNSLAAIAIGLKLGFTEESIKTGFNNFAGVKRRFTKVDEIDGIKIIDDYAHHPIEIQATLSTANQVIDRNKGQKIITIVQPHRYTRLRDLFSDFTNCFDGSDIVYVADVFSAGENAIEGISSEVLVSAIKQSSKNKDVIYLDDIEKLPELILNNAKSGDLVLFMGAGSVTKWAYELPQKIEKLKNKVLS